ncbi:CinA family protein [Streptomyces sp. NPDC059063]|uniref:CinA family protein n=1 Tax=unclassified Streptomyces TaxID=2593676 RepID=UPI0036BC95BD
MRERGETLAVAESLTGGLVAAEVTAVPGASRAFRGAVTAYATELKRDVLGVDGALLAARGAVDAEVALQMAAGARRLLGADWGVATTGVAGPEPQDGQPVGTVFVAVAGPVSAGAGPVPAGAGPDSRGAGLDPRGAGPDSGDAGPEFHGPGADSGDARSDFDGAVTDFGGAGHGSPLRSEGNVAALRLNGNRTEIRMESVRSVLELLVERLSGERAENGRAQDTEQNGGT